MSKKLLLFSQSSCGQCKAVHMLLDRKKIIYEECQDIEVMKSLGINHTPALKVDEELLQGKAIFDFINTYKGE